MIASTLHVSKWRGSIVVFEDLYSMQPSAVHENIRWHQAIETIAPQQPRLVQRKEQGRFFLTSKLCDAPLSGVTLERAKARGMPCVGKMRSSAHVVAGTMLKLDLDGVCEAALAKAIEMLDALQIAFILYTTYSHGLKSGIRARLLLPLDAATPAEDYRRITCGTSTTLFGNVLDPSEGLLHQLAGCAVAHPKRRNMAFRIFRLDGYCLHAKALLKDYQTKHPNAVCRQERALKPTQILSAFERTRIQEALTWIDASDYQSWCRTGMMLKAAERGEYGLAMWLTFSGRATSEAKQREHESRYNPETMWDRFSPVVSANVAVASILARAREATSAVVLADLGAGKLDARATAALEYLHKRHATYCKQLVARYTKKLG